MDTAQLHDLPAETLAVVMNVPAIGVCAKDPAIGQAVAQLGDPIACDPELFGRYVAAYKQLYNDSAEDLTALAMLLEESEGRSD